MEVVLKNVGLVKDSSVKIDGLTVITGANNAGKSTVGKALYAAVEGMSNLEGKRNDEMIHTYIRIVRKIREVLRTRESENFVRKIITAKKITAENIEGYIGDLFALVNGFTKEDTFFADSADFEEAHEMALEYLRRFRATFDRPMESYARDSILETLLAEMNGQIYPIRCQSISSEERRSAITVRKEDIVLCQVNIINNQNIDEQSSIGKLPIQNAVFIDNPYILDNLSAVYENNYSHNAKNQKLLCQNEPQTIVEKSMRQEAIKSFTDKIHEILPGHLFRDKDGYYYDEENNPFGSLRVENLATGSKLLAILHTLLENGSIDMGTMLILDEPESHLHPSWQNFMAELIAMLVGELKVSVLLTTHSVDFMLAVETFMRKYKLQKKSHFYMAKKESDGSVIYEDKTNQLDEIYLNFAEPFIEIKSLRTKYMQGE